MPIFVTINETAPLSETLLRVVTAREVVTSGDTQGLPTHRPVSPGLVSSNERGDVVKFRTDSKKCYF